MTAEITRSGWVEPRAAQREPVAGLLQPVASDEGPRTMVVMMPEPTPELPRERLGTALDSQLGELGVEVQLSAGRATLRVAELAWDAQRRPVSGGP